MKERLSKKPADRFLIHAIGATAETVMAVQTRIELYDRWQTKKELRW